MCCTLESTLSDEELFLEQAFPRKYIVSENVIITDNALGRDKFSAGKPVLKIILRRKGLTPRACMGDGGSG